jgi:hypothetical protein
LGIGIPSHYAHSFSLGGVISYDILANQSQLTGSSPSAIPSHIGVSFKPLLFQPSFLFAIGSPISAVLIMRGQCPKTYKIPSTTRFYNIFNLYDPLVFLD